MYDIDFIFTEISSTGDSSCVLVLHEDIFDYVIVQFSFLKDKAADWNFVTLAGHVSLILSLLVETVEIDAVFFLWIDAKHLGIDFLIRQIDSHLLQDESFLTQNYSQQSHFLAL